MKMTGGEIVVRALEAEGVPFAFGIPGTHNIELYDALGDSDTVRPILVTDEQSASFMADAVWRASGRLGCANVVPGAGLTHALSGIAEAFMDNIPLLVLGCGIRRDTGRAFQLHDIDQLALVRPITKAQFLPRTGQELYTMVRDACRIARAGSPGPVFVEVPAELYLFRHDVDTGAYSPDAAALAAPDFADVERAATLLGRARRPLLYLGLGAAGAGEDLVRLAERLGSPVATTFQGKGAFPESHPLWLWPGFGEAAPPFVREIARRCDATLAIGCRFGEVATGSYGVAPPRPLIHVDIDPDVPGRNVPADLAVTADAALFVRRLLERLGELPAGMSAGPEAAGLRVRIRQGHARLRADGQETNGGEGRDESARGAHGRRGRVHGDTPGAAVGGRVSPARLLHALQRRFGPDAIFTTDSGNGTFLAVEHLRLDRPGRLLAPVDYSCMGYAVPAAIGAKLARPDSPVIALAGDGAFLMTGLELLTAVQYEVPIITIVLRDGELAQIAQFQRTALGRKTASEVHDHDLIRLAESLGVEAFGMASDAEIDGALERAAAITAEGRPVVIDCAIDYSQPTFFTRGVVRTNLLRLPWPDRLRFVGRAVARKVFV